MHSQKLNVEGSDELEFFGNFWAKVGEYYDEVTKKDDDRKWDRLKMLDRRMTQRKAAQQPEFDFKAESNFKLLELSEYVKQKRLEKSRNYQPVTIPQIVTDDKDMEPVSI
ncbi:Hypothetical predicted protein [Mytilus galloprovincialis]|uniref:Uncharacterized protein n=1 Tax=Mytilus galloprovincialis TaxID=29158 RepID=A0A8B6HRU9_MYTGA|nr:Hypothetical predicted protein [Mytilus galloprovincialis]